MDFSELSNLALKYAAAGAKAYGASLIVFHAERFEPPAYFTPGQIDELTRQMRSARRGVAGFLRQHAHRILGPLANEIALTFAVADAHPVDAVLAAAKKRNADLIVLGTNGRGGAKRLWLGSVAENVVRQASAPVFVVRQTQHVFIDPSRPEAAPELKTILCPVNFSEAAKAALQVAASIAERFQARLIPMCVVEAGEGRSLSDAEAKLGAWIGQTVTTACAVELASRRGRAAEQIVTLARDTRADLVVIGAQRRGSAGAWLFGGTTELVLRQAPVPVLVAPAFTSIETL